MKSFPPGIPDIAKLELEAQLAEWEAELPKRPQPKPYKVNWSELSKEAKANWTGKVERRVGFTDIEIADMWRTLKLEPKRITSPDDPDFCGYDEKGRIKQLPPRHLGRRGFYRVVKNMSGNIEEEEFDAFWEEADQDGDGLLSFDEFARIMKFERATDEDAGKTQLLRKALEKDDKEETAKLQATQDAAQHEADERKQKLTVARNLRVAMRSSDMETLARLLPEAKAIGVSSPILEAAEAQLNSPEFAQRPMGAVQGNGLLAPQSSRDVLD